MRQLKRRTVEAVVRVPGGPDNLAYDARSEHANRDGDLILTVIRATAAWNRHPGTNKSLPTGSLSSLINDVWEQPRLRLYAAANGLHIYNSRYPTWVPWSPGARDLHASAEGGKVVFEHVTPVRVIVQDLVADPPTDIQALIAVLLDRLAYTVLAPFENRQITSAGYAWKLVPGNLDPWERYRAAGLDPGEFKPLQTITS